MTRAQSLTTGGNRTGTQSSVAYNARVGTMDVLLSLTPAAVVLAAATVLVLVLI